MPNLTCVPVASPRLLYRHVGLLVQWHGWPAPKVLSITRARGIAWFTVEQFTQGRGMYRIDHEPGWQPLLTPEQMFQRTSELVQRPYGELTYNCDHLTKWVIGQPVESPQVQGVTFAILAAFAFTRLVQ